MGQIVQSFLTHYDTAVATVTRWHNTALGGGGLFHFNPAIDYWLRMNHNERLEALNTIRERRIRGNLRQVDHRFFLALRERGHDIKNYRAYWKNSIFKQQILSL